MHIRIDITTQTLELFADNARLLRRYAVSTATNGAGERNGSFMTPRGIHRIRAKIGAGQPENTVFVRRRPTGETWSSALAMASPGRDWILTRILWLSGCEPGKNRLGAVDTMRRYIYIHGTPDTVPMGVPGSIGCVRMRNADIIELFDLVPAYTTVVIVESGAASGIMEHSLSATTAMPYTSELIEELNTLLHFNLDSTQQGIKIHKTAAPERIAAAERLYAKGFITLRDGGFLTDRGREAAGHARAIVALFDVHPAAVKSLV